MLGVVRGMSGRLVSRIWLVGLVAVIVAIIRVTGM